LNKIKHISLFKNVEIKNLKKRDYFYSLFLIFIIINSLKEPKIGRQNGGQGVNLFNTFFFIPNAIKNISQN
tara:strand:+ start:329 stop:541 length:213 start_codon:yes stop_codon:yes gene_type:complete